jgi:hypothetical protein
MTVAEGYAKAKAMGPDAFTLASIAHWRKTQNARKAARGKTQYPMLGLHPVRSGYNALFTQVFGKDPIAYAADAATRGVIALGGEVMQAGVSAGRKIYLPADRESWLAKAATRKADTLLAGVIG